eukprot:GDKI01021303.1.p1 GENE.GDKI01021303.1~~GDKI01021303.1.p1  ORF type:complete len:137 (-),score=24.73 GDKI01021303.1:14-424(-)
MRYTLFPRLDFLSYAKRIHVSYYPGRDKTEVAKRLIMHMTSENTKKKFPDMTATWEFLSYDAPASLDIELKDGKRHRMMLEQWSKRELSAIVDKWKFNSNMEPFPEHEMDIPTHLKDKYEAALKQMEEDEAKAKEL